MPRLAADAAAGGREAMMEWADRSVLEGLSWRLASELTRRHPHALRLIRAHPGGGQYDCLWLMPAGEGPGDLQLNRNGTIQVLERFDGRAGIAVPVTWDHYIRAEPYRFLTQLEESAGLPAPTTVPVATPTTLTHRVLAAIAMTAVKSVEPIEIASGMNDSSLDGGGPNLHLFALFPHIDPALLQPRSDDLLGQPQHRFWFVIRNGLPVLATEQHQGLAWTTHHRKPFSLMDLYVESRRHLLVTALELLRRIDHL